MTARRFELHRDADVTGISGTGTVAEGVQFTDHTVALRWLKSRTARPDHVRPTTVLHDDIDSVTVLHSHDGRTRVVWLDDAPRRGRDRFDPAHTDPAIHTRSG